MLVTILRACWLRNCSHHETQTEVSVNPNKSGPLLAQFLRFFARIVTVRKGVERSIRPPCGGRSCRVYADFGLRFDDGFSS